MRTVAVLFDAPIPASAAARALVAAGFSPRDITLIPALPDLPMPHPPPDLPPDDPARLVSGLLARGLPRADATFFAEGVRRGAILLTVAAPSLSAPVAVDVIASTLPPDPAELAQAWAANPHLRYPWPHAPAPVLIAPQDQPDPLTASEPADLLIQLTPITPSSPAD